ncbi:MAG: efflux transporter outer membrane subunit [Proteobacteria bacterium]|nr:efflux transporter outer membrane subunit [Pseudomonadota bacterium]
MRHAAAPVALAAALLLAACASPGPQRTPQRLTEAAAVGLGADATTTAWPDERWWQRFGDPALSALVEQALAGQPSLRQAEARLRQAEAGVAAADAGRLPQVQASVDLTDQRFTAKGMIPAPLAGATMWNNSAQLGASWELDLFGRQRAALDAAIGQQRAAAADAQAARVLLAAQVAGHWFALARQQELQRLSQRSLQQREQVLALVRQRIAAGLDTAVERHQAEGLVAQSRAELEALAEGVARERHALAELSGQAPQALAARDAALAPLHSQPLPGALGADLLGRRADLVAQRWRVEAALKDVAVARTRFYPDVNLVAFFGLSSLGLDNLLNAGARTYGAGPALRLPVFEGGRLRAQLAARGAEADAAVEAWNATLLRALREVADEVATLQALDRQQGAQAQATAAAEAAFDLALQRYQAGLGNFLSVLAADGTVLTQRRAAADLKARHLGSEVALARALGGGYHADALPPLAALKP